MRKVILIFAIALCGCTIRVNAKYKCVDGVIYIEQDGAWIQSKLYEKNKCLPMKESK